MLVYVVPVPKTTNFSNEGVRQKRGTTYEVRGEFMKKIYWCIGFVLHKLGFLKMSKLPPGYKARAKDWHKKHGAKAPPVIRGKNGLALWLNRKERRKLGFDVKGQK